MLRDGFSDIAHKNRLQLRFASAEQRHDWHHACQGRQAIEEAALGAEDDARAEDGGRGKTFCDQLLADASGTGIGWVDFGSVPRPEM